MGRCRTKMVLRTADDREVTMGDSNRADRPDPIDDTDSDRGRPFTGANIASDKRQHSRRGVHGHNGRRDVLCGGQCENFRRESRSLCLRKHCKNGTDNGIELPWLPVIWAVGQSNLWVFRGTGLVFESNGSTLARRI